MQNFDGIESQVEYQKDVANRLKDQVDKGKGCKNEENVDGITERRWCAFQCFKETKYFEEVNVVLEKKLNNQDIAKECYDYSEIDYIEYED